MKSFMSASQLRLPASCARSHPMCGRHAACGQRADGNSRRPPPTRLALTVAGAGRAQKTPMDVGPVERLGDVTATRS